MSVYISMDGQILTDQHWVCNCEKDRFHSTNELVCQKCKRKYMDSHDAPAFDVLRESYRVSAVKYL